jgi:hypothetical protein
MRLSAGNGKFPLEALHCMRSMPRSQMICCASLAARNNVSAGEDTRVTVGQETGATGKANLLFKFL